MGEYVCLLLPIVTNKEMQGVPKGSYHNYCRSNLTAQQTHRVRSVRNSNNRQLHPTEEFNDFETYLRFLQQKERQEAHPRPRPHTTDYRHALTARPETRPRTTARPELQQNREVVREGVQGTQGAEREEELVKPYFPFFKCRIEGEVRAQKVQSQFRLRNHKFKLNYRIIEENMGRRERVDEGGRGHQFFDL